MKIVNSHLITNLLQSKRDDFQMKKKKNENNGVGGEWNTKEHFTLGL